MQVGSPDTGAAPGERDRDRRGHVAALQRHRRTRCSRRATTSPPSCSPRRSACKRRSRAPPRRASPRSTAKLKELGVPVADGALKDGSGLDRGNRVTCANLVATLALAAASRVRHAVRRPPGRRPQRHAGRRLHRHPAGGQLPGQDRLPRRRHRPHRRLRPRTAHPVRVPRQRAVQRDPGRGDPRGASATSSAGIPTAPPVDALVPAPAVGLRIPMEPTHRRRPPTPPRAADAADAAAPRPTASVEPRSDRRRCRSSSPSCATSSSATSASRP